MLQHREAPVRANAMVWASGERENPYPMSDPPAEAESVRHFLSPVAREKSTTPNGPPAEQWKIINIPLPSPSQASGPGSVYKQPIVVSLRSAPPSAGTAKTPSFFPSQRLKAITLPSVDQEGAPTRPLLL